MAKPVKWLIAIGTIVGLAVVAFLVFGRKFIETDSVMLSPIDAAERQRKRALGHTHRIAESLRRNQAGVERNRRAVDGARDGVERARAGVSRLDAAIERLADYIERAEG